MKTKTKKSLLEEALLLEEAKRELEESKASLKELEKAILEAERFKESEKTAEKILDALYAEFGHDNCMVAYEHELDKYQQLYMGLMIKDGEIGVPSPLFAGKEQFDRFIELSKKYIPSFVNRKVRCFKIEEVKA